MSKLELVALANLAWLALSIGGVGLWRRLRKRGAASPKDRERGYEWRLLETGEVTARSTQAPDACAYTLRSHASGTATAPKEAAGVQAESAKSPRLIGLFVTATGERVHVERDLGAGRARLFNQPDMPWLNRDGKVVA